MTQKLDVAQVKAMLKSGEIFAFFDVREEGEFSLKGHPLFAHVTLTRSERSPVAALVTAGIAVGGPLLLASGRTAVGLAVIVLQQLFC